MKSKRLLTQVHNPHGLRELAALETPLGETGLLQRGALRGFGTWKVILVLTALLAAAPLSSPFLQAAIIFSAGTEFVGPGGSVNVPISVSGFTSLQDAQFSLQWTSGVLQYVGTGNYNSTLTGVGLFGWNVVDAASGHLGFFWNDSTTAGQMLADGTTIFTVQLNAIGGIGTSSLISFVDSPTERSATVGFTDVTISTQDGQVTVVPEPINWALGLFACVFVGGATVRWISNRRMSSQGT